jgi:hypothetical protein
MLKCRFCGHENPHGVERCQSCGTWLDPKADGTAPVGEQPLENPPEEARPLPEGFEGEILDLMKGGKKIEAIKRWREKYNCGLKEAKDAVEALAAEYKIVSQSTGCAGAVLVMLLAGGALFAGLILMINVH